MDFHEVANLFLTASILVVVGCALEDFTPFRDISDGFREAVFPEQFLYIANVRDQTLFGMVRPKLFTAEPSFVAIFFVVTTTVWLVLSKSRSKFLKYFLLLGLGLFLIRSPVMLLGAITGGAAALTLAPPDSRSNGVTETNRIVLVGLALIVSALFLYVALATILSDRLDMVLAGHDDSFTIRITAPFEVAWKTIARNPIFGAGINNRRREGLLRDRGEPRAADPDAETPLRARD